LFPVARLRVSARRGAARYFAPRRSAPPRKDRISPLAINRRDITPRGATPCVAPLRFASLRCTM
jgi:hypothetical protein